MIRGLILGPVIAALICACVAPRVYGPRFTGTCDGACSHYVTCKADQSDADFRRCMAECPDVFSDRRSLETYEGLSCEDAVEFVDGVATRSAAR